MQRVIRLPIIIAALCLTASLGYAEELIKDETGQLPQEVGGWGPGYQCKNAAIDIDGEVGHMLEVQGPRTMCRTDAEFNIPWSVYSEVASGTLPPGIELNNNSSISGIPTQRGHWIVTMKISNIQNACGQPAMPGFKQQLRFHITGTGKVIE